MKSNLKFQSLPIADDNQKIEVSLDENEQISIKLSTWAEGLGWCGQKTLNFDAALLEDLQRALAVARHKIIREKVATEKPETQSAKIIRLPFAA